MLASRCGKIDQSCSACLTGLASRLAVSVPQVQRTLMELLAQLDGFEKLGKVGSAGTAAHIGACGSRRLGRAAAHNLPGICLPLHMHTPLLPQRTGPLPPCPSLVLPAAGQASGCHQPARRAGPGAHATWTSGPQDRDPAAQ